MLDELKRRRVFRVAAAYAVVAFVIWQAADFVFPALKVPDWVASAVVIVTLLGFPFALALAWAFDITPEGVKRTVPLAAERGAGPGRRGVVAAFGAGVVVAFAAGAVFFLSRDRPSQQEPPYPVGEAKPAMAVLPFDNISRDPADAYFADGMTETLIAKLAKIEGLRVSSRTSVIRYEDTDKTLPQIASELRVRWIVEGSAFIVGDSIRITAQLIEARNDHHLWADQYDGALRDVFSLHSEVARDIADRISVRLTPQDETRMSTSQAVDPEAFKLYVRGLHFRHLEGADNYVQAAVYFQQAIGEDPGFALAHARLALCRAILIGVYGYPREELETGAREAAARALELNADLSEGYVAVGLIREFIDLDWKGAEEAFQEAIRLSPGSLEPRLEYGLLLNRWTNDRERTFAEFRRALALDPASIRANGAITEALILYREYEEAIEYCQKVLALEPNEFVVRYRLGYAYLQTGRPEQGLQEFEKMLALERGLYALSAVGYAYGVLGRGQEAREILAEIKRDWPDGYHGQARVYGGLGEWDAVLSSLEAHFDSGRGFFPGLFRDSFFDPIRAHPRFQALLEKYE